VIGVGDSLPASAALFKDVDAPVIVGFFPAASEFGGYQKSVRDGRRRRRAGNNIIVGFAIIAARPLIAPALPSISLASAA
jgi:hypothetical protein